MEFKDLIISIKQFDKLIIPYKEYCDVFSKNFLFRNPTALNNDEANNKESEIEWAIINNLLSKLENSINSYYPSINIYNHLEDYEPIYSDKYQYLLDDGQRNRHWEMLESIAIRKMYEQIENLLDSIDVELTILEMENPKKHEFISRELLPTLLINIQNRYGGYDQKSPHQICTHIFKYDDDKNTKIDHLNAGDLASSENEQQQLQKKHRIKILYELGILDYLKKTYPKCRNNESEIARIICLISSDFKKITIQSYINDIMGSGLDKTKDKDLEIISLVDSLKN